MISRRQFAAKARLRELAHSIAVRGGGIPEWAIGSVSCGVISRKLFASCGGPSSVRAAAHTGRTCTICAGRARNGTPSTAASPPRRRRLPHRLARRCAIWPNTAPNTIYLNFVIPGRAERDPRIHSHSLGRTCTVCGYVGVDGPRRHRCAKMSSMVTPKIPSTRRRATMAQGG